MKSDRVFPDHPKLSSQLTPKEMEAYTKVKVKIQVYDEPRANRKVYLRIFDPDDPSAPDNADEDIIDNNDRDADGNFYPRGGDNRWDGFSSTGVFLKITPEGQEEDVGVIHEVETNNNGYAEAIVKLSVQPGNNFKVAGVLDNPDDSSFNPSQIRSQLRIGEGKQEEALRVWFNDKKVAEGDEPDIQGMEHIRATPLLTVWRRLWVEFERMGLPPLRTRFGGDDPPPDSFGMPLIALEKAMQEAYIDVKEYRWRGQQAITLTWWKYNFVVNDNEDETDDEDWKYCISGGLKDSYGNERPPTRDSRDDECQTFWVVYVVGVYELGHEAGKGKGNDRDPVPNDLDNDPDEEHDVAVGHTLGTEPEASLASREQERDVAAEGRYDLNQSWVVTIAHEIGHQFELPCEKDISGHLMGPAGPQPWRWLPRDIKAIREIRHP